MFRTPALFAESSWIYFKQNDPYILIPFFGYMAGVMVIAYVAHRYQKAREFEEEYYVGGRSFGPWVLALSWVATIASGGSFLGYPSLVYSYGWSMAFWVSGSIVTALIGLGIVGKRINRLARQTGALTLVDLLRDRYRNDRLGVVYALLIVGLTSVYLIAQFVAGARILESMLGTSYVMGLLLFALSVVAYTTYGGFRAVAWTDTMQGVVMIVGIVILVPLAVYKVGGLKAATTGLADRVDSVAEAKDLPPTKHAYLYGPGPEKIPKKDAGAGNKSSVPFLPISMGISLFMLRSLGSLMMPTTVPRMLAFKDTRSLRYALMLLAPYLLLMYGSSLITMNCAHALNLAPGQPDLAVPELAKLVAPPLLAGLLIAAPFAAVMSTVDSALLVISASVVRDLIQKTFMPNLKDATVKYLSYTVTAVTGVTIMFAAFLIEPKFLQPLVIHFVGASSSVLVWPALATFFWRRATSTGVACGLTTGVVVYIVCIFFPPFAEVFPLHPFVYGFFASAVATYVGSMVTPPQPDKILDRYFGRP